MLNFLELFMIRFRELLKISLHQQWKIVIFDLGFLKSDGFLKNTTNDDDKIGIEFIWIQLSISIQKQKCK